MHTWGVGTRHHRIRSAATARTQTSTHTSRTRTYALSGMGISKRRLNVREPPRLRTPHGDPDQRYLRSSTLHVRPMGPSNRHRTLPRAMAMSRSRHRHRRSARQGAFGCLNSRRMEESPMEGRRQQSESVVVTLVVQYSRVSDATEWHLTVFEMRAQAETFPGEQSLVSTTDEIVACDVHA